MSKAKTMLLEADPTLMEKNLLFVKNDLEDDLNSFLNPVSPSEQIRSSAPFKMIKPFPGICIKTYKMDSNDKFFFNVCHTDEMPAPIEITESELHKLIEDQRPSEFKVPLSMTKPRESVDKSNKKVEVCDVAINSNFFNTKIKQGTFFYQFLISVIFELVEQRYELKVNLENFVVLKNRQFIDKLVEHQIYNRDVKYVKDCQDRIGKNEILGDDEEENSNEIIIGTGNHKREKNLIQEISTTKIQAGKQIKPKIEEVAYSPNPIKQSISMANTKQPEHRLTLDFDSEHEKILVAEFYMPEVFSLTEIILEVGEDRLLVEARKHGYLFDGFLKHNILQKKSEAEFDNERKILKVTMPIAS